MDMHDITAQITVEEAKWLIDTNDKTLLVDVREDREMAVGYIRDTRFILVHLLGDEIERLSVEKDSPVIIYCSSGGNSALAALILRDIGYKNAYSLEGGFNAWMEAGYEVVSQGHLTTDQLRRYSRHLLLKEIGEEGQARLLLSKVLIVGAGGLGSPAGLYLAACGVGTLGIADFDRVATSNLNRQIFHGTPDVRRYKIDSAKDAIERINPDVRVNLYRERVTASNVMGIIDEFDIVIDAADNVETKFLLNDACFFAGKPYIYGGAVQFDGQMGVFHPKKEGPCLRCMFPKPPPQEQVPT